MHAYYQLLWYGMKGQWTFSLFLFDEDLPAVEVSLF